MLEKHLSRMQELRAAVIISTIAAPVIFAGVGLAQNDPARDVTFTLARLPENPRKYSLVFSDPEERSVSGEFSLDQLRILRAIMAQAEQFALSAEGVGVKEAIVTRFADKQEQAFVVDVEKLGNQSRLFVTLSTEIGRMTADAGRVNRSVRREEGFFFDLLDRLDALLPKPTK